MDCTNEPVVPGGLLGTLFTALGLPNFLIEWLPFVINLWILKEMTDAQDDAEAEMEEIANKALEEAELLFSDYQELREFDASVYAFANGQPGYAACDRKKHAVETSLALSRVLRESMASTSRFDCGTREDTIRRAMRHFVTSGASEMEAADQFERQIEDIYLENQYFAITGASYTSANNHLAGGFQSAGALFTAGAQAFGIQVAGAAAGVGYFGGNALGSLFGGSGNGGGVPQFGSFSGGASPVSSSGSFFG